MYVHVHDEYLLYGKVQMHKKLKKAPGNLQFL